MSENDRDQLDQNAEILIESDRRRVHVRSPLMMESLVDKELVSKTHIEAEVPILGDVHLIQIGGRSIIDKGKAALQPLVDEIIELSREHKIIIGVGGGVRERHTYAQAIELGLPTGALAQLVGAVCKQNAVLVYYLLAQNGGIRVPRADFSKLPFYLNAGGIPVIGDIAPYHFWEQVPRTGRIPIHRPDTGAYLISEVYSCCSCTFIKDVDGIYTADPAEDEHAEFIAEISAKELLARDFPNLPIEPAVAEIMLNARNSKRIRIINGCKPGQLSAVINGGTPGTLIYKEA